MSNNFCTSGLGWAGAGEAIPSPLGWAGETIPSPRREESGKRSQARRAFGEADPMEDNHGGICRGAGGGEGRELRGTWAGVSEPPRVGEWALGEAHPPLFPLFAVPLF